jgi:hypothetical protein
MKAVLRDHPFYILILCAAFVAIGGSFFIFSRLDARSGLLKHLGSVGYFSDGVDGGVSISLQGAGKDVWGFFEWPERGIYGIFGCGAAEKGQFSVDIRQGNAVAATLAIPERRPGDRFKMGVKTRHGNTATAILKRRLNVPVSRVETYSGTFSAEGKIVSPLGRLGRRSSIEDGGGDPGKSSYYLDTLIGSGRPSFLDLSLRRGKTPLVYARDYWNRFAAMVAAAVGNQVSARAFVERQYLVSVSDSLISVATERYVFDGGAHGMTTMLFDTIDAKNGDSLPSSEIFLPGWEEKVGQKLGREALRVFAAEDRPSKGGNLKDFGLFEDKIKPSSGIFLCRSGVGFHYDRYELGPYSAGDFMFVLPWAELKGLLKNPGLGESFR